jgi:hypothetical protein
MATTTPTLVDVPPKRCLVVDGRGSPDDEDFQRAVATLYSTVYRAKFLLQRERDVAVKVPLLEGLFDGNDRESFAWTLLIPLPDELDDLTVCRAVEPEGANVRVEVLDEGTCAEVIHVGPYDREGPTIARLHDFIRGAGRSPHGRHHEIYLNDPRRTRPERLRTIVRQPVA